MRTTQFKPPRDIPYSLMSISSFAGVNFAVPASQIADNECSDISNFEITQTGRLRKRLGYELVVDSLTTDSVNGMYLYKDKFLVAIGTKLYNIKTDDTLELLYSSLNNHKVTFFTMNGKLYILDGANYLQYDGTEFKKVQDIAYIPTLYVAAQPATGVNDTNTMNEPINLLSPSFKISYSADGTTKTYKLGIENLDSTLVKAWINNVEKVEVTDFTVDRTKGEVTFLTAPEKGTDNVIIQAFKTNTGYADRINKCTLAISYGGLNDTHIILSGNPDSPAVVFRGGAMDATYFSDLDYQAVGETDEPVTGFCIQYDSLVIFKNKSIWSMSFELSNNGAKYPVKPLNGGYGCINPDTIELIENAPFFLDRRGVYILTQSNVREEKNIALMSEKVNRTYRTGSKGLLQESNLEKAVSVDYDSKYILAVNGRCYIFDYRYNVWYIWDNIYAECFLEVGGRLYWGYQGKIYRFKLRTDVNSYNDLDQPISCKWYSKAFDFKADERLKTVKDMYYSMLAARRSSVDLYYMTEDNEKIFQSNMKMDLFSYDLFDYSRFAYICSTFPYEVAEKIKAKKIRSFQVIFENNYYNESLEISSFDIKYTVNNYVK